MRKFLFKVLKTILKIFYVFPLKQKKVFFESYGGRQYSCSPKYIYLSLNYKYEKIWYLRELTVGLKENTKIVKRKNLRYFYHILTAKILITNVNFSSYIPFRTEQVLINTWHGGGAYKYSFFNKNPIELKNSFSKFKYILSSCRAATKFVLKNTFMYEGEVIQSGLPRNDLFFFGEGQREEICSNFYKKTNLPIDNSKMIVLYAPTYRDYDCTSDIEVLDLEKLRSIVFKKFNKECLILIRSHHFGKKISSSSNNIIDVSNYDDMQELLYISDILITDYSSCLWDFSLKNNGCAFIYASDLKNYDKNRGFYMNIFDWGFSVSQTNVELEQAIYNYDEAKYKNDIKQMHINWGSFENGTATRQIIDIINKETNTI